MKRVTVSIPDALERELNAYLAGQDVPPSITTVMQVALEEFLRNQRLRARGFRPGRDHPQLPVAEEGSGRGDLSVEHDWYFAEE